MSLTDHPQIRRIFTRFQIQALQLKYSANNGRQRVATLCTKTS